MILDSRLGEFQCAANRLVALPLHHELQNVDLPDRDGFSVLDELRQRYPAIPVVVLSARNDCESVVRTLALGASGFIPKSGQLEIMLSALELVLAGTFAVRVP